MIIQQIEYLLSLNKYRNFVLAAEACGVTQPTLSAMIQKLEEELDVKIFDRSKKPVEPTLIGMKVIQQAQKAYKEIENIKVVIESESKMLIGILKIGILPTIAPSILPFFISYFQKQYPNVKLQLYEMSPEAIIEQIKKSEIDFGILSMPENETDLFNIPIYIEPFLAYFSKDHPLKDKPLDAMHMPTADLWILKEGHCRQNQIFNFCLLSNENDEIYKAGTVDTLVRIVDQIGGYTILPALHRRFLSKEQQEKLRVINGDKAVREISIVVRNDYIREKMLNAVGDTFIHIIPKEMLNVHLIKYGIRL